MKANCISCNEQLIPNSKFCHSCGSQQKCKSCDTPIVKNAKHCIGCGISLVKANDASEKALNTIKFNQTLDSRSYEVAFTDNVGAGVVEVIRNMSDNQPQLKLYGLKNNVPENDSVTDVHQIEETVISDSIKEKEENKVDNNSEIPHLTDVENTLECSEQHWILVYAFYVSSFGKITFSKDILLKAYKDKRGTASRIANFSNKWKSLFKGFVKTVRTDEFKLTDTGIETVLGLIHGKITSAASKTLPRKKNQDRKKETSTKKKGGKTLAKSVQTEEFDLYKNTKKPSLSDFMKERGIDDNTANRILAIAYYIINICKLSSFSEGNIEYAYKVLSLNKRPLHLHQTILNAKIRNLWFDQDESSGKWKLTRAGEVHFDENFSKK
ncbi:MAG TPA: zinc ribbon domain-containing protein [Leadbetterella sp.]|nr:zinc ribbon domain-containing protein [Leadbetterella sp.]